MNLTRIIWLVGALLMGAALWFVLAGSPEHIVNPASGLKSDTPAPETLPSDESVTAQLGLAAAPSGSGEASANSGAPTASGSASEAAPAPKPPVVRAADAVDLGLDRTIKFAKVVPGNIVPKKDPKSGEMLLYADGKYEIRGLGTSDSPYRVSWECLASASESYMPRLNEREIPQRVALLDGKVVEVEGYLSFPLMVSETKELLVMLNQWDGCCIGVPPTPYDAIEVKLMEVAKRQGRHASFNFGGVRGTLRVDPYLVENWLVGLYVLDQAQMIEGAKPEL